MFRCLILFMIFKISVCAQSKSKFQLYSDIRRSMYKTLGVQTKDIKMRIHHLQSVEGGYLLDGIISLNHLQLPGTIGKLMHGVEFELSLQINSLYLVPRPDLPIPYEIFYHANTRFFGSIKTKKEAIEAFVKNIFSKEKSIKKLKIILNNNTFELQAKGGNFFGGVAIKVGAKIELSKNQIALTLIKNEVRAWGAGKLKSKHVRNQIKTVVDQASLLFPIDRIYAGFYISAFELNKEGLEFKIENRVDWDKTIKSIVSLTKNQSIQKYLN